MSERTRGETRAMRYTHLSMDLMSNAAWAQRLAPRKALDEAFREHNSPNAEIDLPTVHASDLPTSLTTAEAEVSEYAE